MRSGRRGSIRDPQPGPPDGLLRALRVGGGKYGRCGSAWQSGRSLSPTGAEAHVPPATRSSVSPLMAGRCGRSIGEAGLFHFVSPRGTTECQEAPTGMCRGLLGGHYGVGLQQRQTAVQKPRQPRTQIEASRQSRASRDPRGGSTSPSGARSRSTMASSASAVALPWRLSGIAVSHSADPACNVSNVPTASRQRCGRLRRSVGWRGRVTAVSGATCWRAR